MGPLVPLVFFLRLRLIPFLNLLGIHQAGGALEAHALRHLFDAIARGAVGGGFGLEEHSASADVLGGGEVGGRVGSARADADFEGAESVDVDALRRLECIGNHLHHFGEDGLGVGFLGR